MRRCSSGAAAPHSLDHAREFDQNAVAGRLDDAPAMIANFRVDQLAPMRLHLREGAFLVGTHESAIPRDVRGENGGQPAFGALRGQSVLPEPHAADLMIGCHAHPTPKTRGLGIPFR